MEEVYEFIGKKLKGEVRYTIVNGNVVYKK